MYSTAVEKTLLDQLIGCSGYLIATVTEVKEDIGHPDHVLLLLFLTKITSD